MANLPPDLARPRPAVAAGAERAAAPVRRSEWALVFGFLLILGIVPVTQTGLELARGERVQFTDLFRYAPTAKNLRQYEATLSEKSWVQQMLRPLAQRLLFQTLDETGAKAIRGRDQWLFYRPDVRYLVEPNQPDLGEPDSKWVTSSASTRRESVVQAVVRFRDQLQARQIALVVVPVPVKPSIYPEQLTRWADGALDRVRSPTLDLIEELRANGVLTVDLFARFRDERKTAMPGGGPPLYLARDTHWTPGGAKLAAETVADRLAELKLAPGRTLKLQTREVAVRRFGDVVEMTQIPGLRQAFAPELTVCEQVFHSATGLLVPATSERPGNYRYPGQNAAVLVLGDSFCRIYQYPEPPSLGERVTLPPSGTGSEPAGAKRLLPGSAGFVSHLMLALQAPVDAIYSDGGAATDVRRKLSTNPELLEGKRVVVWEFVERDIALGQAGWGAAPLPRELK